MFRKPAVILASFAALATLAGCATPFEARVSRFQAMPVPQGQTFVVQPTQAQKLGSLEFATYANLVSQRLQAIGYRPAADPQSANLVVNLDYGVGQGRERIETRPGFGYPYGFGYGGFGFGRFGGFHRGYWGGPFGFYDPFFGPGFGPEINSYTVFPAYLSMRINRTQDNVSLFEGRAEATARNNNLPSLVPNLVDAIFTNFPGNSGETVRVRVPAPNQRAAR